MENDVICLQVYFSAQCVNQAALYTKLVRTLVEVSCSSVYVQNVSLANSLALQVNFKLNFYGSGLI